MIEMVKLYNVKCLADPNRKPSPELLVWLHQSIKKWGCLHLPVINLKTGNVIDGCMTVQILRALGHEEHEAVVVSIEEQEEKILRFALNNHANDWQWEAVSHSIRRIDYKMTGFHSMDYNPLVAADWKVPEKDNSQFELAL